MLFTPFYRACSYTSAHWSGRGKYEVTGRLSGRAAATGIFPSPTQAALLTATALESQQESLAKEDLQWLSQRVALGDKPDGWFL